MSKDDLPISLQDKEKKGAGKLKGLRRRLSCISLNMQQPVSRAATQWAAFRRTKSAPSMTDFLPVGPLRRWWEWGMGWIMSRKPSFARDLEMNEEETAMLGCHSKGSWHHVFYKVRSEIRKLLGSNKLPTTQNFRYDSFSYRQNFDSGEKVDG